MIIWNKIKATQKIVVCCRNFWAELWFPRGKGLRLYYLVKVVLEKLLCYVGMRIMFWGCHFTCVLFMRYIHGTFSERQQQTVQASFLEKSITIGGTSVSLSIWDTAGQVLFYFGLLFCLKNFGKWELFEWLKFLSSCLKATMFSMFFLVFAIHTKHLKVERKQLGLWSWFPQLYRNISF